MYYVLQATTIVNYNIVYGYNVLYIMQYITYTTQNTIKTLVEIHALSTATSEHENEFA